MPQFGSGVAPYTGANNRLANEPVASIMLNRDWDSFEPPAPPPSPAPPPAPAYQAPPALTMPSPGPIEQPAMQGLSDVANGEKLRQEINPEGWDVEMPPDYSVPGERQMPPSSRALSQLAQQQGRVY